MRTENELQKPKIALTQPNLFAVAQESRQSVGLYWTGGSGENSRSSFIFSRNNRQFGFLVGALKKLTGDCRQLVCWRARELFASYDYRYIAEIVIERRRYGAFALQ